MPATASPPTVVLDTVQNRLVLTMSFVNNGDPYGTFYIPAGTLTGSALFSGNTVNFKAATDSDISIDNSNGATYPPSAASTIVSRSGDWTGGAVAEWTAFATGVPAANVVTTGTGAFMEVVVTYFIDGASTTVLAPAAGAFMPLTGVTLSGASGPVQPLIGAGDIEVTFVPALPKVSTTGSWTAVLSSTVAPGCDVMKTWAASGQRFCNAPRMSITQNIPA
jgi:hypothetical protein